MSCIIFVGAVTGEGHKLGSWLSSRDAYIIFWISHPFHWLKVVLDLSSCFHWEPTLSCLAFDTALHPSKLVDSWSLSANRWPVGCQCFSSSTQEEIPAALLTPDWLALLANSLPTLKLALLNVRSVSNVFIP